MNNLNDIYGLKRTRARVSVLELLESEKTPIDVPYILDSLSKKMVKVDQATIYRMMDSFYKKGIVDRLELGEGKFRYELTKRGHHHHFICESCGTIEDIKDSAIDKAEKALSKSHGFVIKRHCLEFYGICKKCQS